MEEEGATGDTATGAERAEMKTAPWSPIAVAHPTTVPSGFRIRARRPRSSSTTTSVPLAITATSRESCASLSRTRMPPSATTIPVPGAATSPPVGTPAPAGLDGTTARALCWPTVLAAAAPEPAPPPPPESAQATDRCAAAAGCGGGGGGLGLQRVMPRPAASISAASVLGGGAVCRLGATAAASSPTAAAASIRPSVLRTALSATAIRDR